MKIASLLHCIVLSTLSYKRHDFQETFFEYLLCVLISLQLPSETFLTLRTTRRDIDIKVHMSSCKVSVVVTRF